MTARALADLPLALLLPACSESHRVQVLPTLETAIEDAEAPPPEATVTETLAYERTRIAYERTMMAWIRTGTSLITFGFTVYKFFSGSSAGSTMS